MRRVASDLSPVFVSSALPPHPPRRRLLPHPSAASSSPVPAAPSPPPRSSPPDATRRPLRIHSPPPRSAAVSALPWSSFRWDPTLLASNAAEIQPAATRSCRRRAPANRDEVMSPPSSPRAPSSHRWLLAPVAAILLVCNLSCHPSWLQLLRLYSSFPSRNRVLLHFDSMICAHVIISCTCSVNENLTNKKIIGSAHCAA